MIMVFYSLYMITSSGSPSSRKITSGSIEDIYHRLKKKKKTVQQGSHLLLSVQHYPECFTAVANFIILISSVSGPEPSIFRRYAPATPATARHSTSAQPSSVASVSTSTHYTAELQQRFAC